MDATSKDALLAAIDAERAGWEALLTEVGAARMELPGVTGDWTFKDVVAHLNGWRELTLVRLGRPGPDEPAPPADWPDDFDEDTDAGIDRINDWFWARAKDRPLADVLAESREQFRRLRDAVAALPEADLLTPGRFQWLGGEALGPAVIGGTVGHLHDEHEPAIRAWLAQVGG